MLKAAGILHALVSLLAMPAGLAALLLPGIVHAEAASDAGAEASRPAREGCVWKPYESQRLGIRLLFEECSDPNRRYVLKENGDWLEQHRPADDIIFGSHRIIRVLSKPASQEIDDAIRENFIERIELEDKQAQAQARKSCRVSKTAHYPLKDRRKITLTLLPTGPYREKIYRELRKEPRDFGCGAYGKGQADTYFEYHPEQSKTKYAFVVHGMDEPLFDENSIEFIEK